MEISKSIKLSEVERKAIEELANSFQTIIDAMDDNDKVETDRLFWDYDQLVDVLNILSDFAGSDIILIH